MCISPLCLLDYAPFYRKECTHLGISLTFPSCSHQAEIQGLRQELVLHPSPCPCSEAMFPETDSCIG